MRKLREYLCTLLQSMRHVTVWCVLCLLLAAGTAKAAVGDIFTVDGITYKTLTASTMQVGDGWNHAIPYEKTSCAIPATVSFGGANYTVTSIGDSAFYNCSKLTSVTFPSSLTSIGAWAFYYCSGLTSVTFPPSLTSIGDYAFAYTGLTSVTFPGTSSLTTIGDNAFKNCSSLTSVTFPASLKTIRESVFYNSSKLTSVTFPSTSSLTSIGAWAFGYCSGLTSVTFPSSLTSIGDNAFQSCSGLTSVKFPSTSSLTTIGDNAFKNCSGLTSVTFPASLTNIGNSVFYSCSKLTSVTFPPSLTSIGDYAFAYTKLTSVTFPASLTRIGDDAFYYCSQLVKVYYLGVKEPSIGSSAFSAGPYSGRILYVPNATSGFTASNWGASSIVYGSGSGSLRVTLAPNDAVTAGARWSIDGGATWNSSGATLNDLVPGTKTVTYKPVSGWTAPSAASVTIVAQQTTTITGTYTQTSTYYTVTFNPNDGNGYMSPQTFTAGVYQALNYNAFTRSGYTFNGWNTDPAGKTGTSYSNGQSISVSSNMTLYAQWTPQAPRTYTVSFNANGGSGYMSPQTFTAGVSQALNYCEFYSDDATFIEWNTDPAGNGDWYYDGETISISSNMTLYAQWEPDNGDIFASLTSPADGSTYDFSTISDLTFSWIWTTPNVSPFKMYFGTSSTGNQCLAMLSISDPSRTSWLGSGSDLQLIKEYCGVNGSEKIYWWLGVEKDASTYVIISDIRSFSDVSVPTYTVSFNANGGSGSMSSQTFTAGVSQAMPWSTFTRSGYNFICWNTNPSGTGQTYNVGCNYTVTSNMTLYAMWAPDASASLMSPVNGFGYDFSSVNPLTFSWKWTKANSSPFRIYFCSSLPGHGVAPVSLEISDPSMTSCVFSGSNLQKIKESCGVSGSGSICWWLGVKVDSITDVILSDTGSFSDVPVPTYTVSFNANGGSGSMSSQTFKSGVSQGLKPNTFTRSRYTFAGWNRNSSGTGTSYHNGQPISVTSNITLYAQWTQGYGGNPDLNCTGGDFSAGTVTPLAPGSALDFKWNVNTNTGLGSSEQFWCEGHASKTGGFDLSRLGGTVTQSHVQSGLPALSNILNPGNQLLNTIPDGRYTLVPIVNHPARQVSTPETNYTNNWTAIAGKRLSVRNTTPSGVDLVLQNTGRELTGTDGVTVRTQVRNAGNSAMTGAGCWLEVFYGYINAEGDIVPEGRIGPGQLVSGLAAGATASYTLNGNVPGGVENKALYVLVDGTDIIPEPNKVNNSYLWYSPSILPPGKSNGIDLEITNMTINSNQLAPTYQVKPGDKLNYSVTIKNNGATLSTPVWLELFGSQDGCGSRVRGASLTESQYLTMPAAGRSQTYQLSQTINSIGDGMYSVMAIVNRDGLTGNPGDMTPLNNRWKFSGGRISLATPTGSGAVNLTWQGIPTFSYSSSAGTMTITGTVINTGSSTSRSFWIEPFVGYPENQTGIFVNEGPLTGGTYCAGLAPGATQYISTTGYVGKDKVVGILIDGTDLVAEIDETDNYDYSELTY